MHNNKRMNNAPKPFAAYDLDGTLFKSSVVEKSIPIAVEFGIFNTAAFDDAYTSKENWQKDNNEGTYNAYIKKLVDAFVGQMAGVRVDAFDEVIMELVRSQSVRRYSFTKRLMNFVADTHENILITGSPTILAGPFVQDIPGIKKVYGSTYEVADGKYTGVAQSVGSKAAILANLIQAREVSSNGSIAVGDTVSDIPMLHVADHPIAFNPSHTLAQYGREFGWDKVTEVKDNITPSRLGDNNTYSEVALNDFLDNLRRSVNT